MIWHWIKLSGQLHSDSFILSERNLSTRQTEDSVGPRAGLDIVGFRVRVVGLMSF
jgi:hypothetical protein